MSHIPVLLNESISYLITKKDGIYIDATFGYGGHSKKILESISPNGLLIAIDRDINAINEGKKNFANIDNFKLYHSNFSQINEILKNLNISKVDGILFDFGVSSMQIDNPERGFSYNSDAFLDMRMDQTQKLSAYDVINTYSEEQLCFIIKEYGEERFAKKIARKIVETRTKNEIKTCGQLNEIVNSVVPKPRDGSNPARRTFQAIRIEVNDELGEIKEALNKAIDILNSGGRICAISFHSLEDRIVKEFFRFESLSCICPKDIPVCVCNKTKTLDIITKKPITPSQEELQINKRSHSAKLRVAQKI